MSTAVPAPGSQPLPRLGAVELAALEHLWQCTEIDVQSLHLSIGVPRSISANTVGSALERLYKKGLATRRKVSHAYQYAAALTADEFAARKVVDAAGDVERLSSSGVMAAFVDLVADVDDQALDRLEQLIAARKRRVEG